MFKLAYMIIKDFGALGIGIIQFGVIGFLCYKFITNHWKHFKTKFDALCVRTEAVENELVEQGKKIAKIEGKLEG